MTFKLVKNNLSKYPRFYKTLSFLCVSLFLAGSLFTYNTLDSSLNRASSNKIENIFGIAGAYIADPILQFIGMSAYIPIFTLFIFAIREIFRSNKRNLWLRFWASIVATIFTSGILSAINTPEIWPFYVGIGGFVGDKLFAAFTTHINIYSFITSATLIVVLSLYYCFAITISELRFSYKKIKSFRSYLKNIIVRSYILCRNIILKLQNKQVEKIYKTEAIKKEKQPVNIVEVKNPQKPQRTVRQTSLKLDDAEFELPDLDLLDFKDESKSSSINQKSLEQNAKLLKKVLDDFGVKGEILKVRPGPVVTLYELEPSPGTKASRVIGLSDDIARSMSSISARISVIPGRNVLGIELPNAVRQTVYLRELMESESYKDERIKLPIALGKDIGGESVMVDLSRMPHLLIAGTTGSGKSVAVNAMILSYLYRLPPDECKFIMIDPKMLELSVYEGIPHLLSPVVTEPKKAVVALKWAVREMEDRYRLMSNLAVRNIMGYNKRIEDAIKNGEKLERKVQTGFDTETGSPTFEKQPLAMTKLPFIVIIVDELADLMLTAGKDIEISIQRLAQMARAAGIHMVMATQRPSVDVITGVIKANFPTRISFQVTSRIDSRTILGEMGAEQLLGMGDMLYMSGGGRIMRVHGPFVNDKEVDLVVKHLKKQGKPSYIEDITKEDESSDSATGQSSGDDLYDQAVAIIMRDKKVSTSYIQRQLKIGYNRAANLIDKMEEEGIISQANHAGKREILVL